jgi:hypothetical protein
LVKKKRTVKKTRNHVQARFKVAQEVMKEKIRDNKSILDRRFQDNMVPGLLKMSKKYGFKADVNKDYGFGPIDLVWNIRFHPILEPLKCGFVKLKGQEQDVAATWMMDNIRYQK